MSQDFFSMLPYCLRSYVEGKHWKEFRDVQIKAFDVLFNSDEHLLISAGTSSGKTEAALFPVITTLYNEHPKRISALYISPLIALIDDQRDRVSRMLEDSGIELYSWHGDISTSVKNKVMRSGEGILQITPESLETIVSKHYSELESIFSDLRFIIIDEVHTFMNSDRGLHLLCELEMIERIAGCNPKRIGLSATLSDFSIAKDWLKANSKREVHLIECETKPNYDLTITFDTFADKKSPDRQATLRRHYERLYDETNEYNCIVFTNNRTSVENVVISLKKISAEKGTMKNLWAHHSSVSKEYRKIAEEKMKDSHVKCTAVATSTLELGIDVGDLDRIIHINAPQTVSSLIQKFGRSGRRNGHPIMVCFCNNRYPSKLTGIEIDLIKAIAEAELCFKDHWIEPIRYSKLPYSLLFQQTLSYVRSRITACDDELKSDILSLYPFRDITSEDYNELLCHMCSCMILDFDQYHKTYCLGPTGDRICSELDLGNNILAPKELNVYCGKDHIGTIQTYPHTGQYIQLAGSSWEVISIDAKYANIMVQAASKQAETFWKSGRTDVHTRLMKEMYCCLNSDEDYGYLDEEAKKVLYKSRMNFKKAGMADLLVDCKDAFRLYPWLGTVHFETLYRILSLAGIASFCEAPYSIGIRNGYSLDDIEKAVSDFSENGDLFELITDDDLLCSPSLGKYNKYVPKELLRKQFCADRLDLNFRVVSGQ